MAILFIKSGLFRILTVVQFSVVSFQGENWIASLRLAMTLPLICHLPLAICN